MEKGWERDRRVGGTNFKLTFSHNSMKDEVRAQY